MLAETALAQAPTTAEAPPRTETEPAYHAGGRDLRYDLLRGFFVFAMIVDHIQGPSWVHLLTGGNRFFASAAEGFIFISGLLAGQVYRRLIERNGLGAALPKLMVRAGHLYVLAVSLTLVFIPLSEIMDLPWAQGVDRSNPVTFVVSILTLHRTYDLVDVPLIYALLLIVSPLAFILLAQGRGWVVLTASWLLWGLYQVYPEYADLPWPIAGNYVFNFSAWQVLFFTGIVLGYQEGTIRRALARVPRPLVLVGTALGTALLIVLFVALDRFAASLVGVDETALSPTQYGTLWLASELFGKGHLGIGRLVAFAIIFAFLFAWTTAFWGPVRRAVGWLLLPLGREALYSYTAHVILAAAIVVVLGPILPPPPGSPALNTVIQLAGVGAIWLLVRYRVFLPTPATRRWYLLSPVAAVGLVVLIFPWDPSPTLPGWEAPPAQAQGPGLAQSVRAFGTPTPKTPPPGITEAPIPLPKPAPPQASLLPPADPDGPASHTDPE